MATPTNTTIIIGPATEPQESPREGVRPCEPRAGAPRGSRKIGIRATDTPASIQAGRIHANRWAKHRQPLTITLRGETLPGKAHCHGGPLWRTVPYRVAPP